MTQQYLRYAILSELYTTGRTDFLILLSTVYDSKQDCIESPESSHTKDYYESRGSVRSNTMIYGYTCNF